MKLRRTFLFSIVFLILIFQMVLCWTIDIAASTLINYKESTLTNGFGSYSPRVVYHLSFYGLIMCFAVQMVLWIVVMQKEKTL